MQVGVPGSGITPLNPRPQAGTAAAAARAEGRPLPSTGSIESIARDKIADYMQGGGETMPKGLGEQHFETLKGLPQRIAQIGKDAAIDEAVGAMTKGRGGSSIFTGNVSNTQPRPETGNVISDLQMNLFERGKARRPQFASPEERALNRRTRREAVGAARKQRMDMRGLQAQGIPPNLALMMTSGGGDNDFLRTAAMVGGRNAVERERNTFLDQRNKDTAAYNEGLLGIKQQEVDEAKRLGDVGIAKEFYGEGGIPRNVQEGLAPGLTRQLNLPTPEEQAEVDYIVKTTPRRGVFTGAKDRNKDIARRIREYGTKLGWDELLIESEIQRASPTAWW